VFRKSPLGRIKDDILLMHSGLPGVSGLRAELLQKAPESLHIFNLQLDFRFARHAFPFALACCFRPPKTSASITKVFEINAQRDL